MTPVFIISLPRSGSTLLQRILSMSDSVHTTSEPWIALSSLYALKNTRVLSEYNHHELGNAVQDFVKTFPQGIEDYYQTTNEYLTRLYTLASGDKPFFVDKTPRYALVVQDLVKVFPDAKYIVLWRNPLSIMASIIETWGKGRWNIFRYYQDLYDGLFNMVSFVQQHSDCITVNYEDLVADPDAEMNKVWAYLDVPPVMAKGINIPVSSTLHGRMGDPTGVKKYSQVSDRSVDAWKSTVCSLPRKLFLRRYLRNIGSTRLAVMGYDVRSLDDQLGRCINWSSTFFPDIFWICFGEIYSAICNFFLDYSFKRNKEV